MKKGKTILRYALLSLAAIIVGINFQTIISSKIVGNEVPMPFGTGISVVMSGSMEPELNVGDLIIIREYKDGQKPQVGDVIVYQSSSVAIVHRVIEVDGDRIVTQGDANNAADESFDVSAVKGSVVLSIGLIGYIVLFLKTPMGIVVTMALAIFLLEQSFRKEKKQKQDQVEALKAEIRALMEEQAEETKSRNEDDL